MGETWDTTRGANLWIMCMKEWEKQNEATENILQKVMEEIFPNLSSHKRITEPQILRVRKEILHDML